MFACILLPNFRLQAALRWREAAGSAALAEGPAARCQLIEVTDGALVRGISPGMTPAQALARDATVRIFPPAPAQEACLQQRLVELGRSLSPDVEDGGAGWVIADLRRAARGTCWQELSDQVVARLAAENLAARVGVAPSPDLARLAAESARPSAVVYDGRQFAASLPLTALRLSESLRVTLRDWGLQTAGDLLALPAEGLVERLPEVRELLDRLTPRRPRPLRLARLEPVYAETFDFEHEIETTEPLLFLLRRFLESLCGRLREVFHVAGRLDLRLPLEDGPAHERTFAIPAPTAGVDALFRVLETHLETLQLERRPVGVALTLHAVKPRSAQFQLFESALRDPNRFGETLARLKALLGNDCVGVPEAVDTHQPDRFHLRDGFATAPRADVPARGLPLRRFRPALTARVRLSDGRPAALESALGNTAIGDSAGPFRLSGDWWDRQAWETEEWDVAVAGGGLYRLSRRRHTWRIEGCYEVCGTPRAERV